MYKHEQILKENGLTIDSEVIDEGWAAKVKEFQAKQAEEDVKKEDLEKLDEELATLFYDLHEIEEAESEEEAAAKQAEIDKQTQEAKEEEKKEKYLALVNDANTAFEGKDYDKAKLLYTEALALYPDNNQKMEQAITSCDVEKKNISAASEVAIKEQNKNAKLAEANKLAGEGKVEEANAAIKEATELGASEAELAPINQVLDEIQKKNTQSQQAGEREKQIRDYLNSKKKFSYQEIRDLGGDPNGQDIVIAGIKLQKILLLLEYEKA